jgi:hypothetical protein
MLRVVGSMYSISALVGALASTLALAWQLFVVAYRFFAGVVIGGYSMLALPHLTPIAPSHRRGAFVGSFQHSIS